MTVVRMSLGAAKCNIVAVSRGHLVDSDSVSLSSGDFILPLEFTDIWTSSSQIPSNNIK